MARIDTYSSCDKSLITLPGWDYYYWYAGDYRLPNEFYDFDALILKADDGTQCTIKREDHGEHFMDEGQRFRYLKPPMAGVNSACPVILSSGINAALVVRDGVVATSFPVSGPGVINRLDLPTLLLAK